MYCDLDDGEPMPKVEKSTQLPVYKLHITKTAEEPLNKIFLSLGMKSTLIEHNIMTSDR